jgi:hypothetical protein
MSSGRPRTWRPYHEHTGFVDLVRAELAKGDGTAKQIAARMNESPRKVLGCLVHLTNKTGGVYATDRRPAVFSLHKPPSECAVLPKGPYAIAQTITIGRQFMRWGSRGPW